MNLLYGNQFDALQKAISIDAIIAARTGLDIDVVVQFRGKVKDFIRENHPRLHNAYLLVLENISSEMQRIDLAMVLQAMQHGKHIIYVDSQLRLVKCEIGSVGGFKDAQQLTIDHGCFAIKVDKTFIYELACGSVVNEEDVVNPLSEPPGTTSFSRPMRQFDEILNDHKLHQLDREQGCRYWKNCSNRLLLASPDKTEEIFHRSLFWWLNHFINDKLSVVANPSGCGQDKVDILIVTHIGSYYIEVKWLGKNEHNTEYKNPPTIDQGLIQLGIYLDNEPQCICGYLVVYDGRDRKLHEQSSGYNVQYKHQRADEPKVLFLESEPPSVAAKRIEKELSK